LLVLTAIARAARQTRERSLAASSVHRRCYRTLCEKANRKPLVYSQFLAIVSSLQTYDLLNSMLERRRGGGFVRRVEPNFDPKHVEDIFKKSRLW